MKAPSFFTAAAELETAGTAFVIVTLVETRGHAPQDVGAKALVTDDGLYFGTVGGGKVEAKAIGVALEMLSSGTSFWRELNWNLQSDVGMTCGGTVKLVFETQRPHRWQIAVFGAGHVAQALVRVLQPLAAQIVCADPRPEWLEKLPNSPNLKKISGGAEVVSQLSSGTYCVVMTQGHASDMPILRAIYARGDFGFLGCIGSDVKGIKLRAGLRETGIEESALKKLHCPVGLDFGNNAPHEIALSIAAQLLQHRDQVNQVNQVNRWEIAERGGGNTLL